MKTESERLEWLEDRVSKQAKTLQKLHTEKKRNSSDDLIAAGYFFSALYFLIVTLITFKQLPLLFNGDLELNQTGDFLAGFFAPLAFLWLYIGIRIQSRELRNQIEQLKENITVQSDIYDVAVMELERHKPKITSVDLKIVGYSKVGSGSTYDYRLEIMSDAPAYDVKYEIVIADENDLTLVVAANPTAIRNIVNEPVHYAEVLFLEDDSKIHVGGVFITIEVVFKDKHGQRGVHTVKTRGPILVNTTPVTIPWFEIQNKS